MEEIVESSKSGKDKMQKIVEVLRKETLEPAMNEAKAIVEDAKEKAQEILDKAKAKSAKMIADTEKEIEKKETIFKASLNQGARQSIEWLKQEIQERLLNQNLLQLIQKSTSSPQIIADMITALVQAIRDEGLQTDLSSVIPSTVEASAVNELLGKEVLEQLKEKSVLVGSKKGGVEIKLHKENITLDLSDTALLELMTRYIRKDFERFFFANA